MQTPAFLLCLAILVPGGVEYSPVSAETVVKEITPAQKNRVVRPQPRKKRNNRPDPPRNENRKEDGKKQAKTDKPAEKPTLFKDIKEGETFYFPTDAEHKYFPYVKLSATSAKSVITAANPAVTIIPMTAESQIVTEKKMGASGGAGQKRSK